MLNFFRKNKDFDMNKSYNEFPNEWNKDTFHHVKIRACVANSSVKFDCVGYLWATNNYVEIHMFDCIENDEIYESTDEYRECECIGGNFANLPVLKVSDGKKYDNHILSVIMHRNTVLTDYNFIYINVFDEDIKRWFEWHPDNVYMTEFPENYKGHYCYETHMGETFQTWKIY